MTRENRYKKLKMINDEEVSTWRIVPVWADEFMTTELELVDAYVGEIFNKQDATEVIRNLSSIFPLNDVPHIKRIKAPIDIAGKLKVVVALLGDVEHVTEGKSTFPTKLLFETFANNGLCEGLSEECILTKIPRWPPRTRDQFLKSKTIWPTIFHEDKL